MFGFKWLRNCGHADGGIVDQNTDTEVARPDLGEMPLATLPTRKPRLRMVAGRWQLVATAEPSFTAKEKQLFKDGRFLSNSLNRNIEDRICNHSFVHIGEVLDFDAKYGHGRTEICACTACGAQRKFDRLSSVLARINAFPNQPGNAKAFHNPFINQGETK